MKPTTAPAAALANGLLTESRSSVAIPELVGLSPEEVGFIDAVIERAPATATTFLTVFKAYNDILQERGLDPQNEVVYYGKLLKLGTLKGKNWGEKWSAIKEQQGYVAGTSGGARTTRVTRNTRSGKIKTRLTTGMPKSRLEDTFTLQSYPEDTESVRTDDITNTRTDIPQYGDTPRPLRRPFSPSINTTNNSLGLHTGPPASAFSAETPLSAPLRRVLPNRRLVPWADDASEVTDDVTVSPSTIPPSYRAAVRDNAPYRTGHVATPRPQSKTALSRAGSSSPPPAPISMQLRGLPQTKERRNSIINEGDAWTKIKEAQDYEEADHFREDRLLERCWEVWKQGYQWIITTHEQIANARDHLILRLALQRWQRRTETYRELHMRISALSDRRRMKLAVQIWKTKWKEKRQAVWRESMRARMQTVRQKREAKLLKDAWANWRQSHRSHLSEQHYADRLVVRFFKRWRTRLEDLEQLDAAVDHFLYEKEERSVERCWDMWRRAMEMRKAERMMVERVDLRIMGQTMEVWKHRVHKHQVADDFYNRVVLKRVLGAWKAARDRIRMMERRADKHMARQDDVLVRAVLRVWKAHERGRLLEGVRGAKLLKQAWSVWKQRRLRLQGLEDLALAFSTRASSTVVSSSLHRWRQVYHTHQNAQSFAVHYHSAQLRFKMLLVWRLQLRARLRMVKEARLAQKYFLQRRFWKQWKTQFAQKKLDKKLVDLEARLARRHFLEWLNLARRQRQRKIAEEIVQQRIDMRIMTQSLTHWVNRVVDIKDRELEVDQQYRRKLLAGSFKKWKALCIRHVEELSLMESYQDVKREENMRRMFYKWLAGARNARHRRLYLQQKEDEMKMTVIAAAWDKWRERFLDIRLQPMADNFLLQNQQNLMFRAFGIWHAKTRSLPAVRFHAFHAKLKAWKIWRDAMPRALQARQAREMDRKSVLSITFERWLKAYKTKIELKAVARARYLRLPTAVPRQNSDYPRSNAPPQVPRTTFSRPPRPISPPDSEALGPSSVPPAFSRPFSGRAGIASLLAKARSASPERTNRRLAELRAPTSISRPKLSTRASTTRAASPTYSQASLGADTTGSEFPRPRSTASAGDMGRSRLWHELRDIQLRSRPLSDRTKSREL